MLAWVFTWGEVCQLMGSITEDPKSKVNLPWGKALPSCLKAEHEGKETQGSPRGWDLGGSRGGDSMDHSNTSMGFTDCFSKANIFQYGSWSLQTENGPKSPHPSQVCLRRLCTIPTSPRVTERDSREAFGTHLRRSIW